MLKSFKGKKTFHKSRKGRSRRQEAEAPDKIQLLNLKKEGGRRLLPMKRLKETIVNYSSWVEKNNKTAIKETLGNKEEINELYIEGYYEINFLSSDQVSRLCRKMSSFLDVY